MSRGPGWTQSSRHWCAPVPLRSLLSLSLLAHPVDTQPVPARFPLLTLAFPPACAWGHTARQVVGRACPWQIPPAHPPPHTHTNNLLQVTNAMEYYFGIRDIPDDQVVDQLLGIPTYKLHEFIDVRTGVIGDFAAQQGCVVADLAGSR